MCASPEALRLERLAHLLRNMLHLPPVEGPSSQGLVLVGGHGLRCVADSRRSAAAVSGPVATLNR